MHTQAFLLLGALVAVDATCWGSPSGVEIYVHDRMTFQGYAPGTVATPESCIYPQSKNVSDVGGSFTCTNGEWVGSFSGCEETNFCVYHDFWGTLMFEFDSTPEFLQEGESVQVTGCLAPYVPDGTPTGTATCTDGTLDGDLQNCIIPFGSCESAPPIPIRYYHNCSGVYNFAEGTYCAVDDTQCVPGMGLLPPGTIKGTYRCVSPGFWQAVETHGGCVEDPNGCYSGTLPAAPTGFNYTYLVQDLYASGDTTEPLLGCMPGYGSAASTPTGVFTCQDGTWTQQDQLLYCEPQCPDHFEPPVGYALDDPTNNRCTPNAPHTTDCLTSMSPNFLKCDDTLGYFGTPEGYAVCNMGTWTPYLSGCQPPIVCRVVCSGDACGDPVPDLTDGDLIPQDGFCTPNATWVGDLEPMCYATWDYQVECRSPSWVPPVGSCPALGYFQIGYNIYGCHSYTPSGTACYTECAAGYTGTPTGDVMCVDGVYDGSYSGCVGTAGNANCPLPSYICSGGVVADGFTVTRASDSTCEVEHGAYAQIGCADGYYGTGGSFRSARCNNGILVDGFAEYGTKLSCDVQPDSSVDISCACGNPGTKAPRMNIVGGRVRQTTFGWNETAGWECWRELTVVRCTCRCSE